MRIAIYGATGRIGSRIAAEAAARGHDVASISRTPGTVPDGTAWHQGDALDVAGVLRVMAGHDVVVSAIGPSREPGADHEPFLHALGNLVAEAGPTRLVIVGGAGSLTTADGTRLVDMEGFPEEYVPESLTQARALDVMRAAPDSVDWTYVSPAPEIAPGTRSGSYHVGGDHPAGAHITMEDFAVAIVDEIEDPAHPRARFTVAN